MITLVYLLVCPNIGAIDTRKLIEQVGSRPNGTGWSGIVQGQNSSAEMPNHLMLLAWATGNGDEIATSLRYATCVSRTRSI